MVASLIAVTPPAITSPAGDSKLPFFPDYTNHGRRHLETVLAIAERLIAERSRDAITAEDIATPEEQ